jgi:hypothetical protein
MSNQKQHCFDNLIGLRGLCENPDNVLFINDLPGIQFMSFANAATAEDVSGRVTFERLLREASIAVLNDARSALLKRKSINLKETVSNYQSGRLSKDQFYDQQDLYVGREFYNRNSHKMLSQRVEFVELKSDTTAVKTIYVEVDGVPYHKEKVTLHQGITRIPIELKGEVIRVYVSICDVNLAKQYASAHKYTCSYDCDYDCSNIGCGYSKLIQSTDGQNWESSSIDPFCINVSCVCDTDDIICQEKHLLAEAVRYKLGVLLMEEIIYSDNKSYFIRNSRSNAERWIVSIMGGEDPETGFKKDSKYWRSLGQAVNSLENKLLNSPCVECTGLIVEESIP